ncbi:DUF1659 domain-containing protein [Clostridiisalibacter paucivorans]|uniref:DUF1659 domain-containing protein n=1 Tax=Clostridiisalibacter paucivorans TaxID=408753 RepID=UPI00047B4EC4|nr:DUF1659 domain-containing protein [Clostridiisalibacter paucivorans]
MAVNAISNESKIKVQLNMGLDDKNNPIIRSKTFSRVKADATDEDVYLVATTMMGLQKNDLVGVKRINEVELEEV